MVADVAEVNTILGLLQSKETVCQTLEHMDACTASGDGADGGCASKEQLHPAFRQVIHYGIHRIQQDFLFLLQVPGTQHLLIGRLLDKTVYGIEDILLHPEFILRMEDVPHFALLFQSVSVLHEVDELDLEFVTDFQEAFLGVHDGERPGGVEAAYFLDLLTAAVCLVGSREHVE